MKRYIRCSTLADASPFCKYIQDVVEKYCDTKGTKFQYKLTQLGQSQCKVTWSALNMNAAKAFVSGLQDSFAIADDDLEYDVAGDVILPSMKGSKVAPIDMVESLYRAGKLALIAANFGLTFASSATIRKDGTVKDNRGHVIPGDSLDYFSIRLDVADSDAGPEWVTKCLTTYARYGKVYKDGKRVYPGNVSIPGYGTIPSGWFGPAGDLISTTTTKGGIWISRIHSYYLNSNYSDAELTSFQKYHPGAEDYTLGELIELFTEYLNTIMPDIARQFTVAQKGDKVEVYAT